MTTSARTIPVYVKVFPQVVRIVRSSNVTEREAHELFMYRVKRETCDLSLAGAKNL